MILRLADSDWSLIMKILAVFLVLVAAHAAVHHKDNRRVHMYGAEYYHGDSHLNRDFQLQDD